MSLGESWCFSKCGEDVTDELRSLSGGWNRAELQLSRGLPSPRWSESSGAGEISGSLCVLVNLLFLNLICRNGWVILFI